MPSISKVSKPGFSPLRTVPPGDPRLGGAALLAGSDGKVIGKATVLSSNLAVTIAAVAFSAREKIEGGGSSGQRISLFLTFPQFSGSTEVSLGPVEVQAVDSEWGFGVLSFSGSLPMPLPPEWLGAGEAPAEGSVCELFYYEERQTSVLSLSGRILGGSPTLGFELDGNATAPDLGTGVFSDQRLVGIVASAPVHSMNAPSYVEVLSLSAMAQSAVTPAVRNLLPGIDGNPNAQSSVPTGMQIVQTEEASSGAPMDADVFLRLIGSGRWVMERAEGVRRATGQSAIQIEHLIASLFESWKGFFAKAQIDERELQGIFTRTIGREIPRATAVRAAPLDGLPVISEQVRQAVRAAAERADERGARQIRSTHLLYGALSVENSGLIQALLEHGLNRENISAEAADEPGAERGADEAAPAAIPTTPERVEAAPASAALGDDALFARLSVSSRNTLGRADAMRRAAGQGAVHMEYLIAGLFDKADGPTNKLLTLAGIDRPKLMQIIRETVGTVVPQYFYTSEITGPPPMSKHVRDALTAAAVEAGSTGPIRSRHLLYGALSVEDCKMAQALTKLGVRKENIARLEGAPGAQPRAGVAAANPTPKMDSDLWSEVDRLGYEAYARTIASLITHKETKAPLTIGIKAPWGAGKTSLMKRVQHLLDGDAKLSEENRSGTMQQGQPSQVTLR
jgi:acid phosphatase family membrane protein YuiD